jgi:hypothetical protein
LETSKKLDQLDFRYLIPGHGNVQTDHNYLRFLNALFEEIIMQVRAAYEKGTSQPDDLKLVVTHKSVIDSLNENPSFRSFAVGLDENFVPSAIQTAYRRIIQGKQ